MENCNYSEDNNQNKRTKIKAINNNISSLPEPTMPPPPPPIDNTTKSQNSNEIKNTENTEPIYEAVLGTNIIKTDNNRVVVDNKIPMQTPLPNENNFVSSEPQTKVVATSKAIINNEHIKDSKNQNIVKESNLNNNERDQRRKQRVEKKLLEMTHTVDAQKDWYNNDMVYDMIEFAEHFFNTHERTPEGTIIATLTRKNKNIGDVVTKNEMLTFCKTDKIPTSHIHMYDPENVVMSCNIFRVSI